MRRYAARNIAADERLVLARLHDDCRDAARRDDTDSYYARNIAFHDAIYHASHNAFLAEMTLSIRNRVAPFRKLQFQRTGRLSESLLEHARIVEAICEGDEEKAVALMRDHLRLVRESVGSVSPVLRNTPDASPSQEVE